MKHVENKEEFYEGVSDAVVIASLRRMVGRHARIGASKNDFPEQKNILAGNGSQRLRVIVADFI